MATNLTSERPIIVEPRVASPLDVPVRDTTRIPYRRVYVWELPIRIFHWVNAAGILLLFLTGVLIGAPQTLWMAEEPSQQYWFGWIRFIHFTAAYVIVFNLLFRIYWGFVGNQYAKWSTYVPYRKEQLENLWETLKVDITEVELEGKVSVGHNYLAALSYLGLLFIGIFEIVSGFGLYASMSDAWLPQLFAWIVPLMGGDATVRQWHHIAAWAFPIFTIIHVYLCFYHDFVEGRGTLSSIIGGWKFEKDDDLEN